MMIQLNPARRALSGAVAATLALAACSPNDGPLAARTQLLSTKLAISSPGQTAGGRIAVDVRTEGTSEDIGGLQGMVRFDAAKLRYVGQAQDNGTILYVNAKGAARGELRIAELNPDGLRPRSGKMVFEVLAPAYIGSIRYEHEVAATRRTLAQYTRAEDGGIMVDDAMSVPSDARVMDLADWKAEAARMDAARGTKGTIALRPGEYRLNLQYGDATLDGAVNTTDAVYIINVAVGLGEIIIGTDAPSRDAVIAGNPVPYNVGGPLAPGIEANGDRIINVSDALGIINEAVFGNQPVVGDVIAGRGARPGAGARVTLSGSINTNRLLSKDTVYQLDGIVRVNGGATLTIQPGTRIEGNTAFPSISALFIDRDGMINASGTALEPIVFTCTGTKVPGCWGGVSVAGNAPINSASILIANNPAVAGRTLAGCLAAQAEGGGPEYGGCNPDDNSGVMRYVIVEFGGFNLSANNELNNLTLSGVGRGTTMEYIQAHGGRDDGIEIFGGSVDLRYLYLTDNSDDSFDYSEGWIGRAQFVLVSQNPADGEKGFEVDNTPATPFTVQAPWGMYGEVWNFTIVGDLSTDAAGPVSGNSVNDAIHYRRGAKGVLRNGLLYSSPRAILVQQTETCGTDLGGQKFVFRNSTIVDMHTPAAVVNPSSVAGTCGDALPLDTNATTGTVRIAAGNPFAAAPASAPGRISSALDRNNPDFRPLATFSMSNAAVPVSRNLTITSTGNPGGTTGTVLSLTRPEFFDASATFLGAVAPANLSKTNAPWYAGWTRTATYSNP